MSVLLPFHGDCKDARRDTDAIEIDTQLLAGTFEKVEGLAEHVVAGAIGPLYIDPT